MAARSAASCCVAIRFELLLELALIRMPTRGGGSSRSWRAVSGSAESQRVEASSDGAPVQRAPPPASPSVAVELCVPCQGQLHVTGRRLRHLLQDTSELLLAVQSSVQCQGHVLVADQRLRHLCCLQGASEQCERMDGGDRVDGVERLSLREKVMTMPKKQTQRDLRRLDKAEKAAQLERNIENELKERLQKGVYGDIYNVPFKKFEDLVGVNEEPEEEEEEQGMVGEIEYVDADDVKEMSDMEDMEDFEGLSDGDTDEDDHFDDQLSKKSKGSGSDLKKNAGKRSRKVMTEVRSQ
nr:unnamed protein product [Digitaria exilis]